MTTNIKPSLLRHLESRGLRYRTISDSGVSGTPASNSKVEIVRPETVGGRNLDSVVHSKTFSNSAGPVGWVAVEAAITEYLATLGVTA